MPKKVLLTSEIVLICLAFIVVTASIILALCVRFVIPLNWIDYPYASSKRNLSEADMTAICHCDARQFTTDTINCIPRSFKDNILNTKEMNDIPFCEKKVRYPYLVAIHAAAYSDDNDERRLVCTAIILSPHWILSGKICMHDKNVLHFLRVRAGSMYWSKGGTEHRVTFFSKYHMNADVGPIAYKVCPEFKFDQFVQAVKIRETKVDTTWVSATTAWWREESIRKFEKFVVQTWTTTPCSNCQNEDVVGNPACKNNFIDSTLVTEENLLIGFYRLPCGSRKSTEATFININDKEYVDWIYFLEVKQTKQELNIFPETNPDTSVQIYEVKKCVQPTDTTYITTDTDEMSAGTTSYTGTTETIQQTDTTVETVDTVTGASSTST